MKKYFIFGGIILTVILILVGSFLERCNKPKVVVSEDNPTISVTPITGFREIKDLDIKLPNREEPKLVISVPTPVPVLGKKVTPHVVVSDKGNTYVAYTEKLDVGFRFDPKLTVGYSNNVFLGVGVTVFKIWRFETDVLLVYEIDNNIRLGVGESYQLTHNTSIGATFTEDINLQPAVGIYLSLKF